MNKDTVDDSLMRRATRTGPQELIHPSQLMPVLISLCEEALYTSAIRQELDDGWVLLITCCVAILTLHAE